MHAVVWKVHGYCFKKAYFIKKRRSPTPWRPLLKGSNIFLMQKQFFKHFSRGLQGVGDLLFFIKHGIYRAISMHFSNNCMHAPYIVPKMILINSSFLAWKKGMSRTWKSYLIGTQQQQFLSKTIFWGEKKPLSCNFNYLFSCNSPMRGDKLANFLNFLHCFPP